MKFGQRNKLTPILLMQGMDDFKAKINIEVQWTTEPVIAAIERNGGTITTAFYDIHSLFAIVNPKMFFRRGKSVEGAHILCAPFSTPMP